MLAVLIYIVEAIRRTLRKLGRTLSVVAESFQEAQEYRRKMPRVYMEE
jgi:hypothetical protein